MDKQQTSKAAAAASTFDGDDDFTNSTAASSNQQQFVLREDDRLKQEEEYRQELMKVQDEIITLRQVLGAKLRREHELKNLLGVGFVEDLKQDWNDTVTDIKASTAYQKTAETFAVASEKLAPTIQTVNTTIKSSFGSLRNSSYFKTFESTLGSTVSAVKSKIAPSKSAMDFNNDDNEPLHTASGNSMSTSATHDERLNFGGENFDTKK